MKPNDAIGPTIVHNLHTLDANFLTYNVLCKQTSKKLIKQNPDLNKTNTIQSATEESSLMEAGHFLSFEG